MDWTCVNLTTSPVAFNANLVVSIIQGKASRAHKYDWDDAEEKWLLITAEARSISNVAGREEWLDEESCRTVRAVDKSPFDRVYFWERPHDWIREL
jgi:hypothetical protein